MLKDPARVQPGNKSVVWILSAKWPTIKVFLNVVRNIPMTYPLSDLSQISLSREGRLLQLKRQVQAHVLARIYLIAEEHAKVRVLVKASMLSQKIFQP